MKSLTSIFLSTTLVIAVGCVVGCNSKTSPPTAMKASNHSANLQSVTFYVDGMV